MTVQKFITYNSLDIDGKVLSNEHKLELNVLEESGNYLIHRDILRHQSSQKQGRKVTKVTKDTKAMKATKATKSLGGHYRHGRISVPRSSAPQAS